MTRPLEVRAWRSFEGELVVDNFAGGGGASTGIEAAIGRPVDIAINHSPEAIALHTANHPETRHYCENIWEVDPVEACGSRPVGLAWFSPDCTHFSKAKGGKPRSKEIRGLAWVVIRWASTVRPRVIVLENVEEFETWGPLDDTGRPIPERAGETYREWRAQLAGLGYSIDERLLVAADYGTPTTRKRLFLVARRDGAALAWPDATHGKGRAHAWRPASEIVDWSLPCPSIFERRKALADATLRRVAAGVRRYVIEAGRPFIVPVTHPRDARVHAIDEPVRTITAANRGELALVAPTLVQTGYGERAGQAPRALDIGRPLGTVVAGGAKHALVAALITKHYGSPPHRMRTIGHDLATPLSTVTSQDHHALTAAFLTKFYGTSTGSDMRAPLPTVTAGGQHLAEVRALLERFADPSRRSAEPSIFDLLEPRSREPGIVTIDGERYAITDIGMRMLQPHELFAAQGFPDHYRITPDFNGRPLTKTAQIELAGNSVCPPVAEAIVAANARGRAERAA